MKNRPRQYLYNYIALVIGLFFLFFSLLFIIRQSSEIGLILLLLSIVFLTTKKVVDLDVESKSINVYDKVLFWHYNNTKFKLEQNYNRVIMTNIINEQFGIDKKSSTFYAFEVLLVSNANRKTKILTTVNKNNAKKVAKFLSTNLQIDIEHNKKMNS